MVRGIQNVGHSTGQLAWILKVFDIKNRERALE